MRTLGKIGFVWGVGGVLLLLVDALFRLTPIAVQAFSGQLSRLHWIVLLGWTALMLVVEGYRGFHTSFSPRVVARALYLLDDPRWRDVLLAPFFCMSLYRTTRRRLVASWGMTAGIVSLILIVRSLSQPWRGLVDLGVVAALSVGFVSTVLWLVHGLKGRTMPFSPELGEPMDESERETRGLSQAPTS
ncbi:MAG: hypothetical protein GY769_10305 [bacterium]|nr:hypothetical protein [bacterium]